MYYVIFECETIHKEETPKDHTKVTSISYQFVNSTNLEALSENPITLNVNMNLEEFIKEFESTINSNLNGASFVLCSLFSTWHLRVTIPRQARDENWILPSFLQHPKIFDLWKEFDRWCINRPELLNVRKPNKVKDLGELAQFLEFGLSEELIQNSKPIEQCRQVLSKLHEQCTSSEDLSMVLTHPYDSYLDIRTFLQERSKVLYMNNLPPDTTQSELESWFTQFGARPVGFWTVKNVVEDTSNINNNWSNNNSNYVEEQDSISGFVVFQSHEEATNSLVLNGRTILSNMANTKQPKVVEHVVEIQPSSARVLDRVQEILSPFPQSKNKPRPGDWNCPSCGFSNFQRRTACFRCSFPATSAITVNKVYKTNQSQQHFKQRPQTPIQQFPQQQRQPQQYQQQQIQQVQQQQRRYQRFNHSQILQHNTQQNVQGTNVPFRAGDWKCLTCTYHNFAKNMVCLRCGGPKTLSEEDMNAHNCSHNGNTNNNGFHLFPQLNLNNMVIGNNSSLSVQHSGTSIHQGVSLDTRSTSEPSHGNWTGNIGGMVNV